jgi:ATP-dependent protease ClpP protease subunit
MEVGAKRRPKSAPKTAPQQPIEPSPATDQGAGHSKGAKGRRRQPIKGGPARATGAARATDVRYRYFDELEDDEFFGNKVQHVYLYADISDESVGMLKQQIRAVSSSGSSSGGSGGTFVAPLPILVHLNSNGGDVYNGMRMRTLFQECSVPIAVLVDGASCSAGTFLSVLAPYRVMVDTSTCLIHDYAAFMMGKREDLVHDHRMIEMVRAELIEAYLAHSRLQREQLIQMMKRDIYLGADFCLAHGVCDRVIRPGGPEAMAKARAVRYARLNPQYSLSYAVLLRKTNVNRLQFGCDESGYNQSSVAEMDALLHSSSQEFLKPVVVQCDGNMCVVDVLTEMTPVLARLRALRAPTYAVIDTAIDLLNFLPALFCTRRIMYQHAVVEFSIVRLQERAATLRDTVDNTKYVFDMITGMLRRHTALPAAIIDSLDRERYIFGAKDCKRYGLVDEIVHA